LAGLKRDRREYGSFLTPFAGAEITGEKSKTKAITTAMKEYIRQKKIKELIALRGKIHIDYDWEKEEEMEMKAQAEREKLFEK